MWWGEEGSVVCVVYSREYIIITKNIYIQIPTSTVQVRKWEREGQSDKYRVETFFFPIGHQVQP